ncbi:MAG TPA: Rne/Rng family ribonuclease [Acetobacteraceae bacterium]|jgi:ribonuclease E|nr:Rne/Rng family ribonuclease [Acetobacteraceae bacterium]
MTKRMLIDATHAEETRVVVLDGNRLEDFDVETSTKRQLKGNIYLAKVVRVEPSLQAAFVEYGGNRHGFLAFGEIHPDYYQIPVADRQRLLEMQAEEARLEEEEEDRAAERAAAREAAGEPEEPDIAGPSQADEAAIDDAAPAEATADGEPIEAGSEPETNAEISAGDDGAVSTDVTAEPVVADLAPATAQPADIVTEAVSAPTLFEIEEAYEPAAEPYIPDPDLLDPAAEAKPGEVTTDVSEAEHSVDEHMAEESDGTSILVEPIPEQPPPETVGGDGSEDNRERRIPPRFLRNYKIQEVIKRRQILLVQVVKEERGTKGAALTTYLSLAGRFSVLMPNSPRGGGISRKITSATDRRRLREIMAELDIPQGMGLIVRTAGANRPKPEIKRDCEYLLRLWDDIREHTMKSVAPALIYEEASLIKRAIRDVYSRDIDEIQVDGEEGWRAAHDFMRMLMPTHAKKVQLWRNGGQPLFGKYQVEAQLDAMLLPTAQLRSGGYLVINQAEALVAIDVNSGRSTRERGIEETALRTNLEAADEVARQLRLRDLAGLIVIDFIDMESRKHNGMVERRLKEALKNDRARIQVGNISHFGLMEMSRQRLRPSLAETSFIPCPHCGGTGHVRSTETAAVHVLRGIEEEGAKRRAAEIVVHAAPAVALYILNHKRERLAEIEVRYGMRVLCLGDDDQMSSQFRIERLRAQVPVETPIAITQTMPIAEPEAEAEEEGTAEDDEDAEDSGEGARAEGDAGGEDSDQRRRRRRRRRRGGRREDGAGAPLEEAGTAEEPVVEASEAEAEAEHVEGVPEHAEAGIDDRHNRRRGRRGGRRRRHEGDGNVPPHAEPGAEQPELPPVYSGPTPANPFGENAFDIFDVMEQAEQLTQPATLTVIPIEPEPQLEREPTTIELIAEPATPEPVVTTIAPMLEPAALPVVEATVTEPPGEHEMAAPEPVAAEEPPVPANDVAAEPAVKPIIIGGEQDAAVQKKRGWWRR